MKKKIVITIIVFLSLFTIISVWIYSSYNTSNPWNAKTIGDIPVPAGYTRVEAKAGSHAKFLRNLPLKERGTKIMLFTGGKANLQFLGTAS